MSDGPDAMPADPFTPADSGFAAMVAMVHGLRRNGASLVEAVVFAAANLAFHTVLGQAAQDEPPA